MHEEDSCFKSVEKVLSDMRTSTMLAYEMILRTKKSTDQGLRSLEDTMHLLQSNLRQANEMYENLENQYQHLVGAILFLHARIASQAEKIQKDQGIYEELLKEYENLKSETSAEPFRKPKMGPDHSDDDIAGVSSNVREEMIARQHMDEMTREHNAQVQKLKAEKEMFAINQQQLLLRKTEELTQMEIKIERLQRELKASQTRELLAKTPQDLMNICKKNEITLVNEMDRLSEEVATREEDIKQLHVSLQSLQSENNDAINKLHRQKEHKEGTIIILKKQKELLSQRLNTVKKSIEVLKQEAFVTTSVISEQSKKLKHLIEQDVQLEQNYKKTQQDLLNHERLCSVDGVYSTIEHLKETMGQIVTADVSRENAGLADLSTTYDRLQPNETNSLQDVAGSHDTPDPLKIAELYKALYDNHWRDALTAPDFIEYIVRREIFRELFESVHSFCKDLFGTQKLVMIEHLKGESTDSCRADETRVRELMRRETTEFCLHLMFQIFKKQTKMPRFEPSVADESLFVEEIIRICWLMNLTDPPVLLHRRIKRGDDFDPNFYTDYTRQGEKVDFVVLPALMRTDGVLIAKGIVQCKLQRNAEENV